jgi:hypothetical protein
MSVPDVRRCEVCKAIEPQIICLIPFEGSYARTLACGRECFEAVQERYLRQFLEASARCVQ